MCAELISAVLWRTCVCLQVALGDVFEIGSSNSGVNIGSLPAGLPAGRLSVKGQGRFGPSPDGFETLPDGMLFQFSAYLLLQVFIYYSSLTCSATKTHRLLC
jgi:hypothetical protein